MKPIQQDIFQHPLKWKRELSSYSASLALEGVLLVSDILLTKSENNNTPKFYDFTAQVEFTNDAGEVSQHEVKGVAILSEPGKIGKFKYGMMVV